MATNHLKQQFKVEQPNKAWVTDITYIRTREGWLSLAVIIDTERVLNALLMASLRRQPKQPVTVHSNQGCQFTSRDWQDFLRNHNKVASMSRRGNCHDNAVAKSFFQLLKRERIRHQTYPTRDQARGDSSRI